MEPDVQSPRIKDNYDQQVAANSPKSSGLVIIEEYDEEKSKQLPTY